MRANDLMNNHAWAYKDPSLEEDEWEGCPGPSIGFGNVTLKEVDIQDAIKGIRDRLNQLNVETSIQVFETEIRSLKTRCEVLERTAPVIVPIQSLAPEPFEIIKTFYAVVHLADEQYIASFFDANLSASGDTRSEAISNLKDIIVGTFELLTITDKSKLGPGPLQQRDVLVEFIQKKD